MIGFISESEDDEATLSKAKGVKNSKPKSKALVKREPTIVQKKVIKAEGSSPGKSSDDVSDELDQLPPFARAAYTSVFLPTLYNRLGASKKPFTEFSKGDEMVAAVQEVVDRVWPESGWTVKWGDKLCALVRAPHSFLQWFQPL